MFQDLAKELGVAPAPPVDGLLDISNVEEAALAAAILQDLIGEIPKDLPLQIAGVLELVEQPMVESAVQTIVNVQTFILPRSSAKECAAAVGVIGSQKILSISYITCAYLG